MKAEKYPKGVEEGLPQSRASFPCREVASVVVSVSFSPTPTPRYCVEVFVGSTVMTPGNIILQYGNEKVILAYKVILVSFVTQSFVKH